MRTTAAPTRQPAQLLQRFMNTVAVPAALLLELHSHEVTPLTLLLPPAVPVGALALAVRALHAGRGRG